MAANIEQWLEEYAESHQNLVNKLIHWICVPTILWCVLALLWSVPIAGLNMSILFIVFCLGFYVALSPPLAIGMAVVAALCIVIISLHQSFLNIALWKTATLLFVLAWLGQFIGHKIEGKKPSFFKDLQFLLIGPAWLLSFIYRRQGWPVSK